MTQYQNQIILDRAISELKRVERMYISYLKNVNPTEITLESAMLSEERKRLLEDVRMNAASTMQTIPIENDPELQHNAATIQSLRNQSLSVNDATVTSNNDTNLLPVFSSNTKQEGTIKNNSREVTPEEWRRACEDIKPNGCGPKKWYSAGIPNRMEGFDFTLACNAHDQNFSTLGVSFEAANRRFYEDMMVAVRIVAKHGTAKYKQGESLARFYYDQVISNGRRSYNEAQKNAYICKNGRNPT